MTPIQKEILEYFYPFHPKLAVIDDLLATSPNSEEDIMETLEGLIKGDYMHREAPDFTNATTSTSTITKYRILQKGIDSCDEGK